MVVTDLVVTLDDIRDFLLDQAKRSKTVRFIHTMTDRGKIIEYRQRLDDAIAKFEDIFKVSSHLNMNDAIYQLLRENKEMKEMLEQQKTEAMKILEKVEQEDERARQEQMLKDEKEKVMAKEQEELKDVKKHGVGMRKGRCKLSYRNVRERRKRKKIKRHWRN
ncbi:hypothetical protein CPB84DRAFT_720236 [Gymnopilus junonius]|uniref:Uncharacterized protein n=1 Tax=Gymnopilus junonius TaxID=109634 RepID=A0A9P5TNX9_GYMJU|nr:hypothetical protein CPB84DRAFT_720236 [Gymnopilus junonius]